MFLKSIYQLKSTRKKKQDLKIVNETAKAKVVHDGLTQANIINALNCLYCFDKYFQIQNVTLFGWDAYLTCAGTAIQHQVREYCPKITA